MVGDRYLIEVTFPSPLTREGAKKKFSWLLWCLAWPGLTQKLCLEIVLYNAYVNFLVIDNKIALFRSPYKEKEKKKKEIDWLGIVSLIYICIYLF